MKEIKNLTETLDGVIDGIESIDLRDISDKTVREYCTEVEKLKETVENLKSLTKDYKLCKANY